MGERGPRGLRVPRTDLYGSGEAFSFAAELKVVVEAGGECLIGERAEKTVGMAFCLFDWATPRATVTTLVFRQRTMVIMRTVGLKLEFRLRLRARVAVARA